MPADLSAFVSGVLLLLVLLAAAALIGWLTARLLLHATHLRADRPDRPRGP